MKEIKYLLEDYLSTETIFRITNSRILDGGRSSFYCEGEKINLWIRIVDNALESENYEKGYCPGGLYINDYLVEINSKLEKILIDILRKAKLPVDWYEKSLDEEIRGMNNMGELEEYSIKQKINFIESENYLRLGKLTKRI
ncbi:hypothetical protein [Aureivirga sp. CE67]|uniref:hypothetical protein n=1 Tax=Aureivirga sp. CE67 TaxID=1788983 RepID=UPI0018CAF1EF|nr:hypothetical protein [Aureivirga sp. CE67]